MEQKEIAKYIIDRLIKLGVDDVVINSVSQKASQIKFVNNQVAKTGTEEIINTDIFAVQNKRIVSTSIKDFTSPVDSVPM